MKNEIFDNKKIVEKDSQVALGIKSEFFVLSLTREAILMDPERILERQSLLSKINPSILNTEQRIIYDLIMNYENLKGQDSKDKAYYGRK